MNGQYQIGDTVISDLYALDRDLDYYIKNGDGMYNRIIASLSVARVEESERSVWLVLVRLLQT